jgi:hypothetical protein
VRSASGDDGRKLFQCGAQRARIQGPRCNEPVRQSTSTSNRGYPPAARHKTVAPSREEMLVPAADSEQRHDCNRSAAEIGNSLWECVRLNRCISGSAAKNRFWKRSVNLVLQQMFVSVVYLTVTLCAVNHELLLIVYYSLDSYSFTSQTFRTLQNTVACSYVQFLLQNGQPNVNRCEGV